MWGIGLVSQFADDERPPQCFLSNDIYLEFSNDIFSRARPQGLNAVKTQDRENHLESTPEKIKV